MMPIFSSGLAVIPTAHANATSAFNNVMQRTSGAFGVALCTAIRGPDVSLRLRPAPPHRPSGHHPPMASPLLGAISCR